jgi:predicted phosphate transport protein (TIGR00153 family)
MENTMTNVLAGVFGSSPVMPIEQHAEVVHKCARQLIGFFSAVVRSDWDIAAEVRAEIAQLENQADELKNEIRKNLPKSLFMPVPRQDLLELLLVQDKIANRAKDVSGIVMGRKLEIPASIVDEFQEFVSRCVDSTKQARKSVRELDELFTTGFRGAEAELVSSMIEKLDAIETDMDDREVRLRAGLYAVENELNPVDVIFLYQTIGNIGEIADMAERVGRRLELLLSH